MIAAEDKAHSDAVLPVKSDTTIEGESDNPTEVKETFAALRKAINNQ